MTDADMVEDFVIRPLLKNKCEKTGQDFLSYVENHVMETVDWKEDESFEDILTDILSGNTLKYFRSDSMNHFTTEDTEDTEVIIISELEL